MPRPPQLWRSPSSAAWRSDARSSPALAARSRRRPIVGAASVFWSNPAILPQLQAHLADQARRLEIHFDAPAEPVERAGQEAQAESPVRRSFDGGRAAFPALGVETRGGR